MTIGSHSETHQWGPRGKAGQILEHADEESMPTVNSVSESGVGLHRTVRSLTLGQENCVGRLS